MSDTDETKRPGKTLSLKKTETSTVKQSFSHGRTKAVVVEKKRSAAPPAAAKPVAKAAAEKPAAAPAPAPAAERPVAAPRGVVLRQLSDEEKARRAAALADAKVSDAEARKIAEVDAKRRAQDEELLKAERLAAEKRKAEEDARKIADDAAKKRAEAEAARRLDSPTKPADADAPRRKLENDEDEGDSGKKPSKPGLSPKPPAPKKVVGEGERRRGKLTVTRALSGDDERVRSVASYKRHLQRVNKGHQVQAGPAGPRDIVVPETITVAELANRMARRTVDVIKVLMKNGMMATPPTCWMPTPPNWSPPNMATSSSASPNRDVLEGLTGAAGRRFQPEAASAGRHHHGPCRPRQDLAAGCAAQDRCGRGRSRRHHPAYRRLSGAAAQAARRSPSWIRPATRPLRRCAPAAPRSPTSWCWWLRPMTASCPRPSRRSPMPRRPMCR